MMLVQLLLSLLLLLKSYMKNVATLVKSVVLAETPNGLIALLAVAVVLF
jgi:hypothetical protein